MTQGVVHLFEPIEIEQKERTACFAADRAAECVFQPCVQQHPVRQASEAVVQRLVGQSCLSVVASGDILDHRQTVRSCGAWGLHE